MQIRNNATDKKKSVENHISREIYSTTSTVFVFVLLFIARVFSALYSNISDCDETYNYWEPLHKLLHGHGFQTWEYSPLYAIRSYAYLTTMAFPLWLIDTFMTSDKVLQFYLLRGMLALISSAVETFFYRSVAKTYNVRLANRLLVFLLFSPAFYISTTAFLPSSFSMCACMCAYAWWWCYHTVFVPVFLIGLASLYGWPFAALIGIPLALDMVFHQGKAVPAIFSTLASLLLLLTPLCLFDSYYYGKLTIPPLNILLYNVFTQHGPDLYGTEPWWFYFVNSFLNFNVAFLFLLLSILLFACVEIPKTKISRIIAFPVFSSLLVVLSWMLVFFTRPHKEERFLFPIYPFVALCAAWSFEQTMVFLRNASSKFFHIPLLPSLLSSLVTLFFVIFSLSRIFALFHGYNGALKTYALLSESLKNSNFAYEPPVSVCVGKEWYRFPSHFFLPNEYHLKFLKSEFSGQLPGEFSTALNATRLIPPHFNHMNLEQPERYVNIDTCDYLVDLATQTHTSLEPPYFMDVTTWQVLVDVPFLDAARSSKFFRAFYVPFLSHKHTQYVSYHVLKRRI